MGKLGVLSFASSHILDLWLSDVNHMLHTGLEETLFHGLIFPCIGLVTYIAKVTQHNRSQTIAFKLWHSYSQDIFSNSNKF